MGAAAVVSLQRRACRVLVVLVLSMFAGVAAKANITGDTVEIQYLYPNIVSPVGSPSIGVVTVTGVSNLFIVSSATLTVYGNYFLMTETANGVFGSGLFNGVEIKDLTNPSAFTGFSVDSATDLPGFTLSNVTLSGSNLYINFEGLPITTGEIAQVDFTAVTPEPGTAVLWLTGMIALMIVMRERIAQILRLDTGAHRTLSLPVHH